jgi:hypothetical protein
MKRLVLAAAFVLAACSPPAPAPQAEAPPAEPVVTAASPLTAAQLVDCGGAIAAAGNVDPATPPTTDTPASNAVWTILALLDKEPGLAGEAGRREVASAKERWAARPKEDLATTAAACTARFPG